MMTRRERLMATFRGDPVDRPPVSFYEINGLDQVPDNRDPFNIYSDPSWDPLLRLATERTDRIVMRGVLFNNTLPDPVAEMTDVEIVQRDGVRFETQTLRAPGRILTARRRRDPDVNTVWTEEHLLKDLDDLRAFLQLPGPEIGGDPDPTPVLRTEEQLGETGIVMIDTPDPLCLAASLFSMADYTVIALTEQKLFHRLLEKLSRHIYTRTEKTSIEFPGHLWRIYGPEYAAEPYLPPHLFTEYVVRYTGPMVETIQKNGGFARVLKSRARIPH